MNFVPIPLDKVAELSWVWWPFVESIAETGGYSPEQLARRLLSGEVIPFVVWDENERHAVAFGGIRPFERGADRVAEVIWLTGERMDQWVHLIADLEAFALQLGCKGMRMFARRGWKPFLSKNGYSESHVILDKELI